MIATEVYAYTPNGREIREAKVSDSESVWLVQPHNDNYWLMCVSPDAALQAYHLPQLFRAASDRLKKRYPEVQL